MALPQAHYAFQGSDNGMNIKKALLGSGVETTATASYQDNIQDIGMGVASNALQHRFFMVFQYESQMRASPNTVQGIIQRLNEEADTARRYLDLCELEVQEPRYADDFALELLYEIINKRTSQRAKLPEGVFDMTTAVHGVYEAQIQ